MSKKTFAQVLAFLSLGLSGLLFFRVRSLKGALLAGPKMLATSLSPYIAVMGGVGAVLGVLFDAPLALLAGVPGAAASICYVQRVTGPHDGFEQAFGSDWQNKIAPDRASRVLKQRWTWRLPGSPEPRWERNVAFWTLTDNHRQLLCDIWQPPPGVTPSGLAFIYLHGGAWHLLDKDVETRPLFRHLAAQGHVIMDVAYRLCPEVDLHDMLGDVKRAIAWMKSHAAHYGVDPERIVVAGGSAGGHLALLAAYTPNHPRLTPEDLKDVDLSVRAVVAYYPPTDLCQLQEHTGLKLLGSLEKTRQSGAIDFCAQITKLIFKRDLGSLRLPSPREMMVHLLGGEANEVPDMYDLACPATHVSADSPPTLLFHGDHDFMVPVESSRILYRKLVAAGVPVVYVEFPQTDHAFDLTLPRISPAGQSALYDLDRFLALMAVIDLPKKWGAVESIVEFPPHSGSQNAPPATPM